MVISDEKVDQELLLFVAAHELVLAMQAAELLKTDATEAGRRLESLTDRGLVSRTRLSAQAPAAYRVTADGAALIDAALPELGQLSMSDYRHQVAIGWLWLAARHGAFGRQREILSVREMQAADASLRTEGVLDTPGARFGGSLGGSPTEAQLTYPDLGLVLASWGWVAIHAQLTVPDPDRLQATLVRYDRDPQIRGSLFLVDDSERIGTPIIEVAERFGFGADTRVQRLAPDIAGGAFD